MLCEGFVGIMAFLAVLSLQPADYFAINVPPERFSTLNMEPVDLPALSQAVGEQVAGRTGGAVSLAVGMAHVFSGVPGLRGLMDYWYHFAIMFEALFILTTIDTGTRIARFLLQETLGKAFPRFEKTDWLPGAVLSTLLITAGWGILVSTGSIGTIWPMFGIANQLLAVLALCLVTTLLVNSGRGKYAPVTLLPMLFVTTTTMSAGVMLARSFVDRIQEGAVLMGSLNLALTIFVMVTVGYILLLAASRWVGVMFGMVQEKRSDG